MAPEQAAGPMAKTAADGQVATRNKKLTQSIYDGIVDTGWLAYSACFVKPVNSPFSFLFLYYNFVLLMIIIEDCGGS